MAVYFDTSALVKLVAEEAETKALRRWIKASNPDAVSSDLARTEIMRVINRHGSDLAVAAREVLDALILLKVTTESIEVAGRIAPESIRSLDAIHLAVAMSLGDELDAIITYDLRLTEAAHANGIRTLAPA